MMDIFTLGNSSRKVPVIINGQKVPMIIDSGATANVLDYSSFALLSKRSPIRLEPSRVRVYPQPRSQVFPSCGGKTLVQAGHVTPRFLEITKIRD